MTDVLAREREHLIRARADLKRMRESTAWMLDNQAQWGNDELTTRALAATMARRYDQLLDDGVTPLFFGRLDYAADVQEGEVFHIGRRHVTGPEGDPMVVDWRAPVSEPFYRASAAAPLGVLLRRRFGFRDGVLTAYEDDRLDRPAGVSQLLVEDIERPRTGPMRDIVATIQPEQDELVRAGIEQTIAVQGAPGTGKTAVGLHRAAYLLYAHRQRLATGVLIVGPNTSFLSYVQEVLPALGEVKVTQSTVEDLCPRVKVTVAEDPAAVLKGDARLALVLEKALWLQVVRPSEPLVHSYGARRWRVYPDQVRELERAVRGRRLGWEAGRTALAAALAAVIVRMKEDEGIAQSGSSVEKLAKSAAVKAYVDAA
ncbi:MAG: family ATPase, partial [Frankiales bacterium]|nr:family ATPase [Frankiales bacterium]